jgi:hypothetical protein
MHFCSHDSAPPLAIIYSFSLADPSRIVVQLYAVLPTVRTPDFPFLSGLLSPLHFCQHDDEHMISIRILAMAMLDGRRFLGACLLLAGHWPAGSGLTRPTRLTKVWRRLCTNHPPFEPTLSFACNY